jgi:hypothetical protein
MRPGRIEYTLGYTVDLDDPKMMEHAKRAIVDDLIAAVFQQNEEELLAGIEITEDTSLNVTDIPDFLREVEEIDDQERLTEERQA